MKTLKLIITGMALFIAGAVQAQVAVNVSIGSPPPWGPVGYAEERYYYLPDVEAYYDVHSSMFIYYEGGAWVHRGYLPRQYRNYDLYGGYKVVMTGYRGDAPYNNYKEYRSKYARGYHGEAQRTNNERPGRGNSNARMANKGNNGNNGNGRGNGKSEGHGNEKGNAHGNDKSMKEDNGHGEGHGKK